HESTDKLQSMKRQTQESGEAFPYHNAYAANRGISSRDSELAKIIRQIDNDPNLSREEKSRLRKDYVQERNDNVTRANKRGYFDVEDESNLEHMERYFSDMDREQTKDDVRTQLSAKLVERGVPEYVVTQVMEEAKEQRLDDEELVMALQRLMENYGD